MDPVTGKLTAWITSQAPHAHRTVYAHVAGLAEHLIRIRCQDIGGGFGNKVPVYPGYVCAIAGSIVAGVPVKRVENRSENLMSTGFARDYIMRSEMCAKNGKITGLPVDVIADHGAFDSTAQPTKFPAGFFHIVCGSYDLGASHVQVKAVYTNKAPGGVAYRCSFRVTEAMFFQERMMQAAADDLGLDQATFRRTNFVRDDDFPHRTPLGFLTDSGQYAKCLDVGLAAIGYDDFRKEQAEARGRHRGGQGRAGGEQQDGGADQSLGGGLGKRQGRQVRGRHAAQPGEHLQGDGDGQERPAEPGDHENNTLTIAAYPVPPTEYPKRGNPPLAPASASSCRATRMRRSTASRCRTRSRVS